jgi:hypothetical protein
MNNIARIEEFLRRLYDNDPKAYYQIKHWVVWESPEAIEGIKELKKELRSKK